MPAIGKHCEQEGKMGMGAYTDGETALLVSENLVLLCRHCEEHHLLPGVTHKELLETIYRHVAENGNRPC